VLTWDRFFTLRRKRRYLNLGSSVITASTAIGIFGPVIASQDIDGWAANVMGLDPILVLGATTFAVATMGWLCGPSFGTAMFRIWAGRRGWNTAIAEVSVAVLFCEGGSDGTDRLVV
jgi:import inner membrane translocase subunit TIM23